jgi:excisionase family DNA binding protein
MGNKLSIEAGLCALLLTSEVAEIYRVHVETIRRKIRSKELNAIKVGRHWRVPRAEVERINKDGGL